MVLVSLPAAEERARDAQDARTVVAEVETKLPVSVGRGALLVVEECALSEVLGVEGRPGQRGVEHKLVELGVV